MMRWAAIPLVALTFLLILSSLTSFFGMFPRHQADPLSVQSSSSNIAGDINRTISMRSIKIALVKPVFTEAAYNDAFYVFYHKHVNDPRDKKVTQDLGYLYSNVSKVTNIYSPVFYLQDDIRKAMPNSTFTFISDPDVDSGIIFSGKSTTNINTKTCDRRSCNAYDLLILGHQEYVTKKEYYNLKLFVANGGTIIFLDSNVFMAEVNYNRTTNMMKLVKGHGWEFDGNSAKKSVWQRWESETSEWVGSSYFYYAHNIKFGKNPFGYLSHEEQFMTNPNDKIILDYDASFPGGYHSLPSKPVIAAYELHYLKGKVIVTGIFSDDVIRNDAFRGFFRDLLVQYV
jgi:hypothetical protein